MSSQAVEYVTPRSYRWRLATGIAAFVLTRTPRFYLAYSVLLAWAIASMIVRLLQRDQSWWVDPAIFGGVLVVLFASLTAFCFVKQGPRDFKPGQTIRATLLEDRLLLARGDDVSVVPRAGVRRVRSGYGLVFIDADSGQLLMPRGGLTRDMRDALRMDAREHGQSAGVVSRARD